MIRRLVRHGTTAVVAVAAIALFSGCDDGAEKIDVSMQEQSDGYYVGSITGRIIGATDGRAMQGIDVVVTGDIEGSTGASRSVTTDINGYYQFENLRMGDYLLTVEGDSSYSGTRATVSVVPPANSTIGENAVVRVNVDRDVHLLPLSASLSGVVMVEKELPLAKSAANQFPGVGVTVEVYYPDQIPNRYTAITNASGQFTFTGLPANALATVDADLIARPFVSAGVSYAQLAIHVALASGANQAVPLVLATVTNPLVVLKSNVDGIAPNSFPTTGSIKLVASSAIDSSRLSGVSLRRAATTVSAAVSVKGDTLVIAPLSPLSTGATYSISYELFSRDGRTTGAQTATFSTVKGIQAVNVSWQETDNSDRRIKINEALRLTFNMVPVVDPTATLIVLARGTSTVQTTFVVDTANKTLTVTPSANLVFGTMYTFGIVNLKSGIAGDQLTLIDSIQTEAAAAPTQAITGLTLADPTFKADYNTPAVEMKWNRSSDAAKYNIYVKNVRHPSWLLLAGNRGVGDNFNPTQRHWVAFDDRALDVIVNSNNTAIEPFAGVAACSLMVVPTNEAGLEGPASARLVYGIRDEVQPTLAAGYRAVTDARFANLGTSTISVEITVAFTEYMNTTTTGTPTLRMNQAGVTFSEWTWGPSDNGGGKSSATFKINIPGGVSVVTNSIIITNVQDLNSNSINSADDMLLQ